MVELRIQAQKYGGEVVCLAGNHDAFAIRMLINGEYPAVFPPQVVGIKEFKKYGDFYLSEKERLAILAKMRKDEEAKTVLEMISEMRLLEQVDDTLFLHTPPTTRMLQMIEALGVDLINDLFQRNLSRFLLEGKPLIKDLGLRASLRSKNSDMFSQKTFGRVVKSDFDRLCEVFLDTNNGYRQRARRSPYSIPFDFVKGDTNEAIHDSKAEINAQVTRLRDMGINRIIYGHEGEMNLRQVGEHSDLEMVCVDTAFHRESINNDTQGTVFTDMVNSPAVMRIFKENGQMCMVPNAVLGRCITV